MIENLSFLSFLFQTEKNCYLKLKDQLDQESPIKYDHKLNNTWILAGDRHGLTDIEKEMGFKFVDGAINDAIRNCNSGDRILIVDGRTKRVGNICCFKNISIIGVQCQVKFEFSAESLHLFSVSNGGSMYFQNIIFDCKMDGHTNLFGFVSVGPRSKLWANECEFKIATVGIQIEGYLNLRNCVLYGGDTAI